LGRIQRQAATVTFVLLGSCASEPLMRYTTDTTPLVLVPAIETAEMDKRGRFREIFCEVLETRGTDLPDYRSCDEALTRVGDEPGGTGGSVDLGPSQRRLTSFFVPGMGWDCFSSWLNMEETIQHHLQQFGYDLTIADIDGLSSTANNARLIRDAIMSMPRDGRLPNLVLVGFSKGTPDILEALVSYPELHDRIAAVVGAAGAVGGSPLANEIGQSKIDLLQFFPGAECDAENGGALESMRPATRKAWLATNNLPDDIRYYSLMTFPEPERISSILRGSYKKIGRVDARNDGQVIFYDQFIPDSTLIGYVNADHWALGVPIARTHSFVGSTFVDQNSYPREALHEALLRFIEEDLAQSRDRGGQQRDP